MKRYKLQKEFATKWVEALRKTPEQNRIKEYYTNGNGCYCGFGLALLVANVDFTKERINSKMPEGLANIENEIVTINDEYDYDFNFQADWIEENVEFI